MKYCSNCGHPVVLRIPSGDHLPRYTCPSCDKIHYENPKLVVGCIPEWEGRILLCLRAIEPRKGYWTLPAGFMENRETTEQAALRETREEAEAEVEIVAPFSMVNVPHISQVHLLFRARLLRPDFRAGHETMEVRLYDEADIPWDEIAFPSISFTLKRFFADQQQGNFGFHATSIEIKR